jgi:hypothetical protein
VGSLDNEVPQEEVAMRVNETLTVLRTIELLKNPDFFIAGTGATRHSTTTKDGMINVREDQTVTNFGNGSTTCVRACGDLPIHIYNKAGQLVQRNITLGDVAGIPGGYSLFSITKLQQDGWVTYGDVFVFVLTTPASPQVRICLVKAGMFSRKCSYLVFSVPFTLTIIRLSVFCAVAAADGNNLCRNSFGSLADSNNVFALLVMVAMATSAL